MNQREANGPIPPAARRFVVVAHRAVTTPVDLNAVTSQGGRWDLLCRCVNAALLVSHAMRRDAELYLVLRGGKDAPKTLRFAGAALGGLNPDERSTAALAFKALEKSLPANGAEVESTWGLHASRRDLPALLDALASRGPVFVLDEKGEPPERQGAALADATFVLSDHENFSPDEEALLANVAAGRISLGPVALHSDHCLAVLNNVLDRLAP